MTLFPAHVFTVYQWILSIALQTIHFRTKCLRHVMAVKSPNFRVTSSLISLKTSLKPLRHDFMRTRSSSSLFFIKFPPILKDHTCVPSITLEVSHLTRMSRSWMRLLDDEILAIWVGCNWQLYSDNPGGRGMGRPILQFRHSPTERSRSARTMELHHPICGPSRSGSPTKGH